MSQMILASYAHCESLLGQEDRDLWLACLFAPLAARPKLHALGAFALEIDRVRDRVREPMAGELRLQWWEDAIMGAARGDVAAHPVAAALLDTVAAADLSRGSLLDALEAHREELYGLAPPSLAALDAHLERRTGTFIRLAAAILAGPDADVATLASHAGVALGILAMMRALPRTASRGQGMIPDDILARHGIGQSDVRAVVATPQIRGALADLRRHARSHLAALRHARRTLDEAPAPAFLIVNLVEMSLRVSEDPKRDPFAIEIAVPQWRRQWILWRAARRGGLL